MCIGVLSPLICAHLGAGYNGEVKRKAAALLCVQIKYLQAASAELGA